MKLKHRNFFLEVFIGIIVVYVSVLILLFDENLEFYQYIGTILVFFGVYLAKKNENKT